jgi:radical SAM protein with 4Fe4S-binding SPASM domain
MCEFDFHYEYALGNINRESFEDIWFGPRAREFRRRFLRDRSSISFCRDCVYDYTTIPGCVLSWEFLLPGLAARAAKPGMGLIRMTADGLRLAAPKRM